MRCYILPIENCGGRRITRIPKHSDIKIWRAAFRLVHQHGEAAELWTAQRLLRDQGSGKQHARAAWSRLLVAVGELQDAAVKSSRPN
jgi:hypothetical protein